jgi:hypothetical protein
MKVLWFFIAEVLPMIIMRPFLIVLLLADGLFRACREELQKIYRHRSDDLPGK